MDWLNYHHLMYFWVVAREGSIAKACEILHLSQPTISTQLSKLERSVGGKLFQRSGRNLQLTETGRMVYRYAEEIFTLGRELSDAIKGRPTGQPLMFTVGIPDVLPKLIVYRLLRPALHMPEPIRLVCREGHFEDLLTQLATHEIDLVLSDSPVNSSVKVRAYSHLLGQCGIAFFGSPALARKYRKEFPQSLAVAPVLLPGIGTPLRRALDQWFDENDIRPTIMGEFEDTALLKVFGQEGIGVFPAPAAIIGEIEKQYGVQHIGTLDGIREKYYAISVERRIKHPAVLAISNSAREHFGPLEGGSS